MSLSTPVAFIIFNRPDITERVFEAIAQAKPKKLLVIADGPRFPEEAEKCQRTRAVIDKVDWDCEVLTNFSEKNLSSPVRCSSGLDWVFSEVEEAIILEDDCLPSPSFFDYCQTLLEYYRNDERIMHISGNNFQLGNNKINYSYYFSKYAHGWGWATWQRAWKYFDLTIQTWPEFKQAKLLDTLCKGDEKKFWIKTFDKVYYKKSVHWDYAWWYSCWAQNGLVILPASNLVSNIGFRPDATHTRDNSAIIANIPVQQMHFPLKHPPHVIRNVQADKFNYKVYFKPPPMMLRIINKVKR